MGEETTARAAATTEFKIPGPKRFGPLDTLRFMSDPRAALHRIVKEYGDPFGVPDPSGNVVMTGHPEAHRAVFTADPDTFDIPLRAQLGPFFGDTSLILTAGARHKQARKLLTPPFNGARMRAYGKAIVESTRSAAGRWVTGKPFVMLESTQAITLDVILRAVFGVEGDERRQRFREAVVRLMDATASPAITMFEFTRKDFGGFGPWARFRKARADFDALVYEELAARRADPKDGEDILSLMMASRYDDGSPMSDTELRDQLHVLLFAGHDTTSTALAWAFYWLHRQPEEREKVLKELDALPADAGPDAYAGLPYLDAVCQETLRINPITLNVGRLLRKPLELCGHMVPAGTTVMMNSILLHDREELYPEPRRFRPERFLERRFSPFEMAPFGGGHRRCIGAALALYEMKLVLATLLRAHRLRLVKDAPVEAVIRGLTMGPKGGIPMVLEGGG